LAGDACRGFEVFGDKGNGLVEIVRGVGLALFAIHGDGATGLGPCIDGAWSDGHFSYIERGHGVGQAVRFARASFGIFK